MSLVATIGAHPIVEAVIRIVGLSILAGTATAIATFVYRVRVRTEFPEGATLILGLGVVAIYLNTRLIFIQFIGDGGDALTVNEAMINVAVFVAAGIASFGGRYVGDKAGQSDRIAWSRLQPDISPIVRAAGRFITVVLPAEIDDIEGYDPVESETKTALSGRELEFPRGLTVAELQSQLVVRLKEKYDIGYVDIDMAADGTVEYLAVGQRASGLGPTLPPKSAAVAVRADPPFSATPGDTVQLWNAGGDKPERVGLAELRATVGDVATVVTDESIARKIDPDTTYRLMTMAADSHPDKEFAAMLRRGDETMSIVEIGDQSPLVGSPIGALDVTVIAVRAAEGEVDTIPKRDRLIVAGDTLFAIGRPERLRKLELAKGIAPVDGEEVLQAAVGAATFSTLTPPSEPQERKNDREDWSATFDEGGE